MEQSRDTTEASLLAVVSTQARYIYIKFNGAKQTLLEPVSSLLSPHRQDIYIYQSNLMEQSRDTTEASLLAVVSTQARYIDR